MENKTQKSKSQSEVNQSNLVRSMKPSILKTVHFKEAVEMGESVQKYISFLLGLSPRCKKKIILETRGYRTQ